MNPNSSPPPYVPMSIMGAPPKFKWSEEIALSSVADKDQNTRLYDAIDKCNFRAKFAIGLAISEWIAWRFKGLTVIQDCLNRIEAGWACSIDTRYLRDSPHRSVVAHDLDSAKGAVNIASAIVEMITQDFRNGSIYLAESVVRQAVLAQRVMPDKRVFTDWLTRTLKEMAAEFPNEATYDEETAKYDYSGEPMVLSAHLATNDDATSINVPEATRSLIKLLDSNNPYLLHK